MVSESDYESAGPSLIPDEGRWCTAHPAVHPPKYLGKPGEGKLWKLGCHSGPVSQDNKLISTTGSKANVARDEHPYLCAATACAPTLPFTDSLPIRP